MGTASGPRLGGLVVLIAAFAASYLLVVPPVAAAGTVSVSPSSGLAGAGFTISGGGYAANETVSLCFGNRGCSNLGRPVTDQAGAFSQTVTVPSGASPGSVTITACDRAGCAQTTFTVLAATTTTAPATTVASTTTSLAVTTTVVSSPTSTGVVSTTTSTTPPTSPPTTSAPTSTSSTAIGSGRPPSTTTSVPTTSTSRAGPRDDATTTSLATSVTPSEPDPSAPAQQPGQLGSTGATGGSEADEIVDEVLAESLLQPDEGGGGAEVDSLEGQQPASPPLGAEQLVPDRDSVGGLDPDFVVAKTRPASYRLDWVRMGALWLITMIVAGLVVFGLDLLKRSRKG